MTATDLEDDTLEGILRVARAFGSVNINRDVAERLVAMARVGLERSTGKWVKFVEGERMKPLPFPEDD